MPDVLTGTAESGTDTTAYELKFTYALRTKLNFERFVTKKPTMQSHRGAVVSVPIANDLAVDVTPLNEYVDVESVGLTDTNWTATMAEYGKVTTTTAKLRGTSMLEFDASASNRINRNAAATINALSRNALLTGATVVAPENATKLTSGDIRTAHSILQSTDVEPFEDGYYAAIGHPFVLKDLRGESDAAGWRTPQEYGGSAQGGIARGELGEYEGFRWFPDNTLTMDEDDDTYPVLFIGYEGLAKIFSTAPGFGPNPQIVSTMTDKLERFRHLGWKWLGGYKVFRSAAVLRMDVGATYTNPAS